ncbi:MAG: tripartite tricarboxylate transporter substrate binding protein [Betaproteobacteria bacterium]|nr:tripartite tricarboxylate transporter substrate binding protein [Betaproteobacteria bacterium]
MPCLMMCIGARSACLAAVLSLLAGALSAHGAALAWEPARPVQLIVGVSAGSAHDRTVRSIQNLLREGKLVTVPVVIVNRPGGGQTIATSYLSQSGADGHSLMLASVPLLANKLTGKGTLTYTDLTPITQLFNEYIAIAVRKDSPLVTGKDLVAQFTKDARSLTVAVGSALGNGPHLALSLAMKEAGVAIRNVRAVVFSGGSEATLAVLGGHVDVLATTTGNVLPLVRSGQMRVIAVSAPRRLSGTYAQVPTWKEQGIDSVFSSFRAIVGPKGLDARHVGYWERVFQQLAGMPAWLEEVERNNWQIAAQGVRESENFLRQEYARLQAVMTDLGLAK